MASPDDLTEDDLLAMQDDPTMMPVPKQRAPASLSQAKAVELYQALKDREDQDKERRRVLLQQELDRRAANRPMAGQIDLTPAAQYLDDTFGGNAAKSAGAQAAKAQDYNKRSDAVFDELQQMKRGTSSDALLSKLVGNKEQDESRDKRFATTQAFKQGQADKTDFEKVQKVYEKDHDALDKVANSYDEVERALSTGKIADINAAMTRYLKNVSGDTRINENEVARVFMNTADKKIAELQTYLTGRSGNIPEADLEPIVNGIKVARETGSQAAQAKLAARRSTYQNSPLSAGFNAAGDFVKDTENVAKRLGKSVYSYSGKMPSKKVAAAAAASGLTPEEAAEMAALSNDPDLKGK